MRGGSVGNIGANYSPGLVPEHKLDVATCVSYHIRKASVGRTLTSTFTLYYIHISYYDCSMSVIFSNKIIEY